MVRISARYQFPVQLHSHFRYISVIECTLMFFIDDNFAIYQDHNNSLNHRISGIMTEFVISKRIYIKNDRFYMIRLTEIFHLMKEKKNSKQSAYNIFALSIVERSFISETLKYLTRLMGPIIHFFLFQQSSDRIGLGTATDITFLYVSLSV